MPSVLLGGVRYAPRQPARCLAAPLAVGHGWILLCLPPLHRQGPGQPGGGAYRLVL